VRVLIDTTFALRGPSGTGVYLERLIGALRALGVDVVEAADPSRRALTPGRGRVLDLAADARWTQVDLPRLASLAEADLIHHPQPARAGRGAPAQVVTVHDLAPERVPECFDAGRRRFSHVAHRAAARRAEVVIAVSQTTATDVMARWGVPAGRIVVARHGPGQEPAPGSLERRPPRHLLYVGDDEPRKNLGLLLAAHGRYRAAVRGALPLVLAGGARRRAEGVAVVERPGAERLAELYAGAAALVHPSRYEGFGLTALEAMSAGVPVVAARSPGLVEVCGDAAMLFDVSSADDLASAMAEVAGSAPLRRDLAERGRRRAAEFSWARSARAHIGAYERAATARPRVLPPRRRPRPDATRRQGEQPPS
jgi:glycosyltransferase involved in cell wall biosynthesis